MIRLKHLLREIYLSNLFEIEDDPDYDAAEDFYRRRDEQLKDLATLLKQSQGKGRVPWKTIPASLLKRVWLIFGKYNRIKENDIDKIADQLLTNIARLQASTEMMGHTSYDARPEIEDNYGITFTDEEWDDWMSNYFTSKRGGWLLSDYGLEPLRKLYVVIFNAKTPEEKLYACDKALNVVHQRGDLAAMFVEGGVSTLNAIANQGGYTGGYGYGDVNREFQKEEKLTERKFPAIKTKSGKIYIGRIHADAVRKTEEDLESVGWWEDGQYYTEEESRRKWGGASTDDLEPELHRAFRLNRQIPEIPDHPVNENVFYRGENDSGKRIDEPFTVARKLNATFASENPHNAKLYGHRITKFVAKPNAKILRYDSPEFWRLIKRRRPPNSWIGSVVKTGEKLVDIVNYLTAIAYKQGYDAVVFSPTDDIGTMIFNKNAFDISSAETKPEA